VESEDKLIAQQDISLTTDNRTETLYQSSRMGQSSRLCQVVDEVAETDEFAARILTRFANQADLN
jgi:hypothetical protein